MLSRSEVLGITTSTCGYGRGCSRAHNPFLHPVREWGDTLGSEEGSPLLGYYPSSLAAPHPFWAGFGNGRGGQKGNCFLPNDQQLVSLLLFLPQWPGLGLFRKRSPRELLWGLWWAVFLPSALEPISSPPQKPQCLSSATDPSPDTSHLWEHQARGSTLGYF